MSYDQGFDALFQGYYGEPQEIDLVELARRMLSMPLNADRMRAGTIESKLVSIFADFDGAASITLDYLGFRANDGERDTVFIGTNGKAAFKQIDITNDMSTFSSIRLDTTGLRATDGTKTTFEIDTQGKAYFRGDITSEATITGATIRTGEVGTNRIELSNGGLRGITSNGYLSGLVYEMSPTGFVDLGLYHNGTKLAEFHSFGNMYAFRATESATSLIIGGSASKTEPEGVWDFSRAQVSNLNLDYAKLSDVPNTTNSSGLHNHGIPDGTRLLIEGGGYVTFHASGLHSHDLTFG